MNTGRLLFVIFNQILGAVIVSVVLWYTGFWHGKVAKDWENNGTQCFKVYKEREAGIRYEIKY